MPKTLKETPLSTRAARAKLVPGVVHWRGVDPQTHLGYRRGRRGGSWLVRWRHGSGYRQQPLGLADDVVKDGEGTLSFEEALSAAKRIAETARVESKAAVDGPPLTVRAAVVDYVAVRDARDSRRRGRPINSDASSRLRRYVIGADAYGQRGAIPSTPLADIALHALAESDLIKWRGALPKTLKTASRRRLVSDLRAALNSSIASNRHRLDPALSAVVKYGLRAPGTDAEDVEPVARGDNQILTDAQVTRLIAAAREVDAEQNWEGDLYRAVAVLAATGMRFSQIIRMRVNDCQHDQARLMVPCSRKGLGKTGAIGVPVGRDLLEALLPATRGRPASAPLLERWRHERVAGGIGLWRRTERGPWQASVELTSPWKLIRERAAMPDAIPYTLRHSSVVRGIRAGLPIRLVAGLHDTSTAMIERHYARWIVSGLEEMSRQAVTPLMPQDSESRVIRLTREPA